MNYQRFLAPQPIQKHVVISVAIFGKFCYFGQLLKSLAVFGWNRFRKNNAYILSSLDAFGQIVIVLIGKIWSQ